MLKIVTPPLDQKYEEKKKKKKAKAFKISDKNLEN